MTHRPKHRRVLGIAPISRGFGYALLDGPDKLADWGLKIIERNKNAGVVRSVEKLLLTYQPDAVVFQDFWAKGSRRADRIRLLGKLLIELGQRRRIATKLLPLKRVYSILGREQPTKYKLASFLALRFTEDLGHSLPANRSFWKSEDSRLAIFEAVGLAMCELQIEGQTRPSAVHPDHFKPAA